PPPHTPPTPTPHQQNNKTTTGTPLESTGTTVRRVRWFDGCWSRSSRGSAGSGGCSDTVSASRPCYLRRIREPRTFCVLNAFRKLGISLSINSKYDDSAGVFCCAL